MEDTVRPSSSFSSRGEISQARGIAIRCAFSDETGWRKNRSPSIINRKRSVEIIVGPWFGRCAWQQAQTVTKKSRTRVPSLLQILIREFILPPSFCDGRSHKKLSKKKSAFVGFQQIRT